MPVTAVAVRPLVSKRTEFAAASEIVPEDDAVVPSAARPACSVNPPESARIFALIAMLFAARSVRLLDDNQLRSLATVMLPS